MANKKLIRDTGRIGIKSSGVVALQTASGCSQCCAIPECQLCVGGTVVNTGPIPGSGESTSGSVYVTRAGAPECYCYENSGVITVAYVITNTDITLSVSIAGQGIQDSVTSVLPTSGNCVSGAIELDESGDSNCELPWSFCCDAKTGSCSQVCFTDCPTCAKQKGDVNFYIGYERYAIRDPDNPSTGSDNAYPSPKGDGPQAELRVNSSDPIHMVNFEEGVLVSSGSPDYEYRSANPSSLVFSRKHYPDLFALYSVCDDSPVGFEGWYDDETISNTRVDDISRVFPLFNSGHYFESQPSAEFNFKYGFSTFDPIAGNGNIFVDDTDDCPSKPSDICDFIYANINLTIGDYNYNYVDNALALTDHRLSTGYYNNNPNPPYFKGFGVGEWSAAGASNNPAIIGTNMPTQLTAADPAGAVTFGFIPNGTLSGLFFDTASVRYVVGVTTIELKVIVTRYYLWYFLDDTPGSWSADQYGLCEQMFEIDNMFFNLPDCDNPVTTLSTGSRNETATLSTVTTRFNGGTFTTTESVSSASSFPISMTLTGVTST